ncbi:MAG: ABC transporter permease [Roseovarius sp.]|nr:ABC transporter permease [Roseovarius sp.]
MSSSAAKKPSLAGLPVFEIAMAISIALMFLIFSIIEPQIMSVRNLSNVFTQASYLVIFACAQSIVILVRGFDLSLGTTVSAISLTTALAMSAGFGLPVTVGILAGLLTGLVIGAFNGFCVAVLEINPFVVTLGTLNILLAISSTITGGFPITDIPDRLTAVLSEGRVLAIPVPILLMICTLVALHLMLKFTVFGRSLYHVGSNPKAARAAGINVRKILLGAYILCSVLIAFGAILMTARTGSGEPNLGGQLTLQTIAAAVIGGMNLRGGEGSIAAPFLGAIFVTILGNGMNLVRIDGFFQEIALGCLIIASLLFDRLRHRRNS